MGTGTIDGCIAARTLFNRFKIECRDELFGIVVKSYITYMQCVACARRGPVLPLALCAA